MINRELKLKLNKTQENTLNEWLNILGSVYNWAIRKIELNAKDKIYFTKFDFCNLLANHSDKLKIPSHTIQGILNQAWNSWDRCFKKLSKKPKFKSVHNKLTSIPFPDSIPNNRISSNKIRIPNIGKLKFFKQEIPNGIIKNARIKKRASGWYLILTIDAVHKFEVKDTEEKVGIDTGFKHLAVLSNGIKIENQRNYIKGQQRLAQAQRGKNRKLAARLQERVANKRKDYNHKVSKKIVEDYKFIAITNDNLRNQSKVFGKSVNDAGINQLRNFILYKGDNHSREVKLVDSRYTTMTCSECRSLTGPIGLSNLAVRNWECSVCGTVHDRDINSACVILNFGFGVNHEQNYSLKEFN